MCRSRRELSNAYFLAKFGFDTAENEPSKACPIECSWPAAHLDGVTPRVDYPDAEEEKNDESDEQDRDGHGSHDPADRMMPRIHLSCLLRICQIWGTQTRNTDEKK